MKGYTFFFIQNVLITSEISFDESERIYIKSHPALQYQDGVEMRKV